MTRKRFSDDVDRGRGVRGNDWHQIIEAEEAVFQIDLQRLPLMTVVWDAYEVEEPGPFSVEAWQDFACTASSLTRREALQWWGKIMAYWQREGLLTFPDGS